GRSTLLSAAAEENAAGAADDEPERAIRLVRRKAPRTADAPASTPSPSSAPSSSSTPEPPPSRRRQFVRAPYVTPVLLVSPEGAETEARSEEISEEGMLVITPQSLPLGAPVQMRFASPMTGEMIAIDGSVRWTREGRGRSAIGLEFTYVPPVLRGVVAQYIAMVPAALE
ncbi:MAG TPA: PilZ domain-containing protein, partial [Polyangiaceae bacterium]|nr:PilZ domain-containing protein [Polyangiaceae bacterium]